MLLFSPSFWRVNQQARHGGLMAHPTSQQKFVALFLRVQRANVPIFSSIVISHALVELGCAANCAGESGFELPKNVSTGAATCLKTPEFDVCGVLVTKLSYSTCRVATSTLCSCPVDGSSILSSTCSPNSYLHGLPNELLIFIAVWFQSSSSSASLGQA